MASDQFLALRNSVLKVLIKNYSKVGIILDVNNEVVVETWIAKRCIADTPVRLYMVLNILYSNLLLKDSSPWVKTQTCFTIWDFVLRNRVKVYYYFATMQLGSIINYKEESLLHFLTLGVWKHCEVTSKIRFDVLFGGMGLWKTLQLRFPFQNRFTVSPSYCLSMSALKREENVEKLLF